MMTATPTISQVQNSLTISGPSCLQRSGWANTKKMSHGEIADKRAEHDDQPLQRRVLDRRERFERIDEYRP
jgi:hypothetical protein